MTFLHWIISFLVVGPWGAAAPADAAPAAKAKAGQVVAVVNDDPDAAASESTGDKRIIKLNAETDGQAPRRVLFKPADGKQIVKLRTAKAAEAGGPWLGIQFGPVPSPLATHLNLPADTGQMVLNVVEGSPADLAGIQQYDVITQFDGKDVAGDVGAFLERVRAFKPNEVHVATLRRGGQQLMVNVSIAARPEAADGFTYKYETPSEELHLGRVFGRGGLLEKDDTGNWVFKGMNLPDLPDFWKDLPNVGDFEFKFDMRGPGHMFMFKEDNGESVRVERNEDGTITVTRKKTENGQTTTTTNTYNTLEELKAAEPDLKGFAFVPDLKGLGNFRWNDKMFHMDLSDLHDLHDLHERIQQHVQEAMKNASVDPKALQEQMEELLSELEAMHRGAGATAEAQAFAARPRTSFEVTENGSIIVRTRDGEDEMVQTFNSPEAMRSARPDLYEKYQRLQDGDGETP